MLTLDTFTSKSFTPAALTAAVVAQLGGWEDFTEHAADVVNHGADGRFSGFTYYTDTVPFAVANLPAIRESLKEQADDEGSSAVEIVNTFRCLKNYDHGLDDVAAALFAPDADDDCHSLILNALAWYALEEVSRAYADAMEGDGWTRWTADTVSDDAVLAVCHLAHASDITDEDRAATAAELNSTAS